MWSGCCSDYVRLAWAIRCRNTGVAFSLAYGQRTPLNSLHASFVFTLLQSPPCRSLLEGVPSLSWPCCCSQDVQLLGWVGVSLVFTKRSQPPDALLGAVFHKVSSFGVVGRQRAFHRA